MLPELLNSIGRLCQILSRQLTKSNLSVNCHEDIGHQGNQRLIRADVRRGLLAPDVLLARGECQDETALTVAIGRLARQPARQLPDVLLTGSNHPAIWPPKPEWHAE